MASAQDSVQNSQTRAVQHNHVVIKYQQPPDPAIINHCSRNFDSCYKKFCSEESSADTICPRLYRSNNSIFTNSL